MATILLVDDEPNVTQALQRAMRKEPFKFLTAASAQEAEGILESVSVDAIVSDEQMPGMPGSEFLARARQRFPHTIRIVLSGQASLEAAVKAINEGGVYRFLLKPLDPVDLAFTLRTALEHQRLQAQSRRLLREFQKQADTLAKLKQSQTSITHLDTDEHGAIVLDEGDRESIAHLLAEMEESLNKTVDN